MASDRTDQRFRPSALEVAVVGLGAFLVFLVQPLAARALLPSFGGSPSVWVTSLVFFQIVLALGYLLADQLRRRLSVRGQGIALALLGAAAALRLPVTPDAAEAAAVAATGDPAWGVLRLLATSVGPPFLLLTTIGPLAQWWSAARRGTAGGGRGAYGLYAVSNGASLAALLGYPFAVERWWGVTDQGVLWSRLFAVVVVLTLVFAWRVRRVDAARPDAAAPVGLREGLTWLGWSAGGVAVLTTVSAYVGQEIAAFPLLWIVPLSLYLVTWIVTFSGAVRPGAAAAGWLVAASLLLMALATRDASGWGTLARIVAALTALVLTCTAVHATLYRSRPEAASLTRFYALVSVGGAVGGLLSGVAAVRLISDWRDLGLAFGLVAVLAAIAVAPRLRIVGVTGYVREAASYLVIVLGAGAVALLIFTGMDRPGLVVKHRDFHGLVRVVEKDSGDPARHRRVLLHGATVHGHQYLDPSLAGVPTTYFGRGTGCDLAFRARRAVAGEGRGLDVGVVGLGAGTVAAHGLAGDAFRFYELSPAVAELSEPGDDGPIFDFLASSPATCDVAVGDARLVMAAELADDPAGRAFDLMILDAFSGDGVPVHLLTCEAMDLYAAHLRPDGVVAFHVSSNWFDLTPVLYAWAEAEGWEALTLSSRSDRVHTDHAVWVLMFRGRETLAALAAVCEPLMAEGVLMVQNRKEVDYGGLRPWTDDRSNLLDVLGVEISLKEPAR